MKNTKIEGHDVKITIKIKDQKPITYALWELISVCWDYVYELERDNPSPYLTDNEMLERLKENFYTCKIALFETGISLSDDLKTIEQFIHKHTKRVILADFVSEVK